MADDLSREEQNAHAREYEPPAVTPIGSIAELTATVQVSVGDADLS